jgi:hypothetical protein
MLEGLQGRHARSVVANPAQPGFHIECAVRHQSKVLPREVTPEAAVLATLAQITPAVISLFW